MKVTILGAGSAYGTPMIFNRWGAAHSNNSKNRRTRASIFLEKGASNVLIDAGPDLREQINANQINDIQSVFLTHGHYDHIAGLPELPRASRLLGHKIDIYASTETLGEIKNCYAYLFSGAEKESEGLCWHELPDFGSVNLSGMDFTVFTVPHHHLHCSAFRCGDFAYITDWEGLDPKAADILQGIKLLMAECNNGFFPEKNGHSSWPEIEPRIAGLNIAKIVLGHLSARVDYDELKAALPDYAVPAHDGMVLEIA